MLYAYSMVAFDGKAYFVGSDDVHGDQLWSSDGTIAGTSVVDELGGAFGPEGGFFTPLDGKLFFEDAGNAFVTDGANAGTVELSGAYGLVDTPVLLGGKIYFSGYTSINPAFSDGLYVTDGTEAGTKLISADGGHLLTAAGNNLFFLGFDPTDGFGIFAYNILSDTTICAVPLSNYEGSGSTLGVAVGDELFFTLPQSADDILQGQLWVTDGDAGNAVMLANGPSPSDAFSDLTALNGKLYFASTGDSPGLWVSDGTTAGTSEILPLSVNDLTAIGNTLYFVATDTAHGAEVWSYSPTGGAASLLVDADPGPHGSSPNHITAGGGGVYFVADDATSASELWHVDSNGGVSELTSPTNGEVLEPGGNAALTEIGDNLYFAGSDSVHGEGLFVTNGSQVTFLAAVTINDPLSFSVVGDLLYFQGADATNGSQVWVSDGTSAGTHLVTDVGSLAVANDFNGDALSDLLWRNDDGTVDAWLTQAGSTYAFADANQGIIDTSWSIAGTGDFNSDGKADILWRNSDGNTNIWLSNSGSGLNGFAGQGEGIIDPSWHIEGVGDFNGDCKADILWQNTDGAVNIWASNAGGGFTGFTGQGFGQFTADWSIAGVGDFNGDGRSDIFWRNSNGDVDLWLSNSSGGPVAFTGDDLGIVPTSWSVAGVGDFNGDGKADIVWRNTNGDVDIWLSNTGLGFTGPGFGGYTGTDLGVVPSSWTISQIGNFNDDGKADIAWRNSDGTVDIWMSNSSDGFTDFMGFAGFTGQVVGTVGADWHIV